jgi:hypothetical protein
MARRRTCVCAHVGDEDGPASPLGGVEVERVLLIVEVRDSAREEMSEVDTRDTVGVVLADVEVEGVLSTVEVGDDVVDETLDEPLDVDTRETLGVVLTDIEVDDCVSTSSVTRCADWSIISWLTTICCILCAIVAALSSIAAALSSISAIVFRSVSTSVLIDVDAVAGETVSLRDRVTLPEFLPDEDAGVRKEARWVSTSTRDEG